MFKLLNPVAYGITGSKVYGELYATTKEEVQTGVPIIGLPEDRALASGSYGHTQDGEIFIYDEETGFKFVNGGGGGSSIDVEPLTITANGVYTADTGKAYNPVTANVPNPLLGKDFYVDQLHEWVDAWGDVKYGFDVYVIKPVIPSEYFQTGIGADGSVRDFIITNRVQQIAYDALLGVDARKLIFEEGISHVNGVASNMSFAEGVVFPSTTTSISHLTADTGDYYDDTNPLIIPEGVESVEYMDLGEYKIVLPSTITELGSEAIKTARVLEIHATTPPTTENDTFDGNAEYIYVPAGSVNAYKAAPGWSDYAEIIEAIPEN